MATSTLNTPVGGASFRSGSVVNPTVYSGTGNALVIATGDTGTLYWQIVGGVATVSWVPNTFTTTPPFASGFAHIFIPSFLAPAAGSGVFVGAGASTDITAVPVNIVFVEHEEYFSADTNETIEFTLDTTTDTEYQGWSVIYKLATP